MRLYHEGQREETPDQSNEVSKKLPNSVGSDFSLSLNTPKIPEDSRKTVRVRKRQNTNKKSIILKDLDKATSENKENESALSVSSLDISAAVPNVIRVKKKEKTGK